LPESAQRVSVKGAAVFGAIGFPSVALRPLPIAVWAVSFLAGENMKRENKQSARKLPRLGLLKVDDAQSMAIFSP
jgi:hypothetical protein